MHGLKVPKKEGERVRQILLEQGLLVSDYKIKRDEPFLYFPVRKGLPGYDVVELSFDRRPAPPQSIKDYGARSFDIIGDIAIVDIPEDSEESKEEIAQILLQRKSIRTVVQKGSAVKGELRTRILHNIGGEPKTETIHTEYGLRFKVDISTVYFNPRLATERWRIAQNVTPREVITDMFCGVGPFSLMIARFSCAEKIYAIDINPEAITLLKENLRINKIENVIPILGDAREEIKKVGSSDRIIMNLPQRAFEFLPEALKYGRIIHYYRVTADIQEEIEKIKMVGCTMGMNPVVLAYKPVKSYSPTMDIVRFDISTKGL
jgi:tRNA (guanine37-N1)-methyltransferase